MSITVINHAGCRSYGLLVRAYVSKRQPELSRFLAFAKHGGRRRTMRLAREIEVAMKREACLIRGAVGHEQRISRQNLVRQHIAALVD